MNEHIHSYSFCLMSPFFSVLSPRSLEFSCLFSYFLHHSQSHLSYVKRLSFLLICWVCSIQRTKKPGCLSDTWLQFPTSLAHLPGSSPCSWHSPCLIIMDEPKHLNFMDFTSACLHAPLLTFQELIRSLKSEALT